LNDASRKLSDLFCRKAIRTGPQLCGEGLDGVVSDIGKGWSLIILLFPDLGPVILDELGGFLAVPSNVITMSKYDWFAVAFTLTNTTAEVLQVRLLDSLLPIQKTQAFLFVFFSSLIRLRVGDCIVAELPPRSEVVTDWAAPKFATKQLDLRLTSLAVIVLQKPAELIKSGQPFADATKLLISFILALRSSAKVNNLVNAQATFNKRSSS